MDSRIELIAGTALRFNDGYEYRISNELARGGSSIVYNAFYIDNLGEKKTVRVKECYPFKCNLQRRPDGALVVPASEQRLFAEAEQKMRRAYQLGNEFFSTDGLTNLTANTYNIFEANNTLYVVSAYTQGQELSYGRYVTVKNSIAVVKSAANAIYKIHNKGFLYLDIKPSNILTLEGTTELIQLFDFDTVVPIADISEFDDKISYTRGFAALELQRGDWKHIGTHTDVYGIGALLFYMLFDRVPGAFDCEEDAEYDFSKSKLTGGEYQDALLFQLTDFFRHTLANYYLDRFTDMGTVAEKLSELEELADLSARYIISSKVSTSGFFLGREKEAEWIAERLINGTAGCSFVVGMGGIGKSTLVRHCLKRCAPKIDAILYLDWLGTIEKTLCDDYAVQINGVRKDKNETEQEYFNRKLGVLRELGREKNCVLVFDNYSGDAGNTFPKLLQLGWHILFLTRDLSLASGYDTLEVGSISQEDALLLFSKNMGREFNAEERRSAVSIIQKTAGHTLVVELIAKQIGSQFCRLSLKQAAEIVENSGFSTIAPERIGYLRDDGLSQKTIKQIISDLFAAEALSEAQCTMLKVLSLFGRSGISVDQVCEMLALESRDDISTLYYRGWISVEDTVITMHPVIEEVVSNWKLTQTALDAAVKGLQYLDSKLKRAVKKEEEPESFLRNFDGVRCARGNTSGRFLEWKMQRVIEKKHSDQPQEACPQREESCAGDTMIDLEKINEFLRMAIAVLESGKREAKIYASDSYKELLYDTIQITPYENEQYIQEKSEELIALLDSGNKQMLLKTYEVLLGVLYDHGRFDEAAQKIRQMRAAISDNSSPEIGGRCYYILSGFYDAVLNGAYEAETPAEAQLVRLILKSVNRAIRWLKVSDSEDSENFLGECYRLKALVLIRSGIGKKKQVHAILEKVRKLIDKYARSNSTLVRDYDMTMAWYYTYLEVDYRQTCAYLLKAYDITERISASELTVIDDQLCPMANIMLEWRQYDKAEQYLLRSIKICSNHVEIAAYARRQVELLGHLLEVYLYAGECGKCQTVINEIDEKVGKISGLDIENYVTEEIRKIVAAAQEGRLPAAGHD